MSYHGSSYCYLGLVIRENGDFTEAIQLLHDKALKASFCLSKTLGKHNYNVNIALKLFDSTVKPILLYGSEIWGAYTINFERVLEDLEGKTALYDKLLFEKPHMKFCKILLSVLIML